MVGAGLGLLIGTLGALGISYVGIPMPPPPGMSESYRGEILLTAPIVLQALSVAMGTTFVASLYPAWKASRLQIVDALRHNR